MKIKTLKDYYPQMYEMFPDIPKEDIKKILNQGWKIFYLYNSSGADVIVKDSGFWSYVGYLKKNPLDFFKYYIKKLSIKLRILYKRYKISWDGYYYFALTDSQYEEYLKQHNKRGPKRKNFKFEKILLYQILDECKIRKSNCKYIFRIKLLQNYGLTHYINSITTDKAELIITREPLKFKDILINDNKYDVL